MKIVDYFGFEQETLADKTTEILNVKHQRIWRNNDELPAVECQFLLIYGEYFVDYIY
jgi:hypothetical protein